MSPRRPLKLCSQGGCTTLVPGGTSKCPRHQARHEASERERKAEYETRRPPRSLPTWDPQWRSLRAAFLREHPLCPCGARAVAVHHKVPVSVDPSKQLDRANLVACCAPCHARIEATTPGHWTRKAP